MMFVVFLVIRDKNPSIRTVISSVLRAIFTRISYVNRVYLVVDTNANRIFAGTRLDSECQFSTPSVEVLCGPLF